MTAPAVKSAVHLSGAREGTEKKNAGASPRKRRHLLSDCSSNSPVFSPSISLARNVVRECHPKQESVFLMHEGGHMRLRLFSAISKFVVRKKSQNLKSSYKKKLKPLSKAKVRKHRHTDNSHDENHQRITELPIQFRHELEIHAVDSSDHGQRQHDRRD